MAVADGNRQRGGPIRILSIQIDARLSQGPRRIRRTLASREHERREPTLRVRNRPVRREVVADGGIRAPRAECLPTSSGCWMRWGPKGSLFGSP